MANARRNGQQEMGKKGCNPRPFSKTRNMVSTNNRKHESTKGAPARESRTGTRLVSPAPGCEKKKRIPLVKGLRT